LPTDAELPNFVNADLIAAGLSSFAPDLAAFKAGRIMLETIAEYVKRGEHHIMGTDNKYVQFLNITKQQSKTWQF